MTPLLHLEALLGRMLFAGNSRSDITPASPPITTSRNISTVSIKSSNNVKGITALTLNGQRTRSKLSQRCLKVFAPQPSSNGQVASLTHRAFVRSLPVRLAEAKLAKLGGSDMRCARSVHGARD